MSRKDILNGWLCGKVIWKDRIVFGGGHPIFRWLPRTITWGRCRSIFWLGTELVLIFRKKNK